MSNFWRHPHPLPKEKLEKLSTQRLREILKIARKSKKRAISKGVICGNKEEVLDSSDFKEIRAYFDAIKAILNTREDYTKNPRK